MNRILKRCRLLAAGVAVAGALLSCGSSNPPNYPAGPIELKYYATGPWAVTVSLGGACCDSAGNKFDLYYPTQLGANGFKHPILTWGNGSFASSSLYTYYLRHMASWGFVVIATQDSQYRSGTNCPGWRKLPEERQQRLAQPLQPEAQRERDRVVWAFAGNRRRAERPHQIGGPHQDRNRHRNPGTNMVQQRCQLRQHDPDDLRIHLSHRWKRRRAYLARNAAFTISVQASSPLTATTRRRQTRS